eukprot:TRINITY_DN2261_c0_g1_i1.p1 TRINITY_DN2261_c0_g1~~TRINITY_DN2261_c0_g1_i1.p1  ORF type:complete len:62 (+),score=4.19 TRINITY_DN2261_c0_g1_i1:848-1033(+)
MLVLFLLQELFNIFNICLKTHLSSYYGISYHCNSNPFTTPSPHSPFSYTSGTNSSFSQFDK